jgi:bifunctional DNA-binding transcriptional regulator/antitoxin component of YhaV-PrlF toxin-antitoxin module
MPKTYAATLKVIKGGRVTIPAYVRKIEKITEGMFVNITVQLVPDGNEVKQHG